MIRIRLLAIKLILKIEQALGFKLYEKQIKYLFTGIKEGFDARRSGFTTIYIVRLLLANNELYQKELVRGSYCDMNTKVYIQYNSFFKRELMTIRDKLLAVGLPVASLV